MCGQIEIEQRKEGAEMKRTPKSKTKQKTSYYQNPNGGIRRRSYLASYISIVTSDPGAHSVGNYYA
jgi:hypothetical protein